LRQGDEATLAWGMVDVAKARLQSGSSRHAESFNPSLDRVRYQYTPITSPKPRVKHHVN
jgi:hypothetical protein